MSWRTGLSWASGGSGEGVGKAEGKGVGKDVGNGAGKEAGKGAGGGAGKGGLGGVARVVGVTDVWGSLGEHCCGNEWLLPLNWSKQ